MFAIDIPPNELHIMSYNEKHIDHFITSCHRYIWDFGLLAGDKAHQIEYHWHCFHCDTDCCHEYCKLVVVINYTWSLIFARLLPQETSLVNEVAKHDGTRNTTNESDNDCLDADGHGSMFYTNWSESSGNIRHAKDECQEHTTEKGCKDYIEIWAVIITSCLYCSRNSIIDTPALCEICFALKNVC